ncbi:MAG: PilZ domain-containing protein [Lachnospiraceae bacterium]|nr:PilZ domain-containing protein [Lachnospiraceae bacterium]
MEEKRRSRRLVLNANLVMERLGEAKGEKVPIEIIDISKDGIGFACNTPLAMNAIYQMDLIIWTKDVIHTFINVTRFDGKSNVYGATFTGMNENDSGKIKIYELFDRKDDL